MSTTEVTLVPETSPEISSTATLSNDQKTAWNKGSKDIVTKKPAPSAEKKEPSASESDETAAAPEAAPKQEQRRDNAASRLQELLKDLKNAGLSPAELKTFKRQAEASAKPDVRPEPSPVAQVETKPKPTLEDRNADGTPKFKTFGEYEDARDQWNRTEAIREFQQTTEKQRRESAQREQEQAIAQSWQSRVDAFKKAEPDFERVLDPKLPIHSKITQGSVIEGFMLDSEQGPQVLYHLEQNPAELDRILAIHNPFQVNRELLKIEQSFSAPKEEKKAPAPVTKAPKPVSEVGGRGTVAADPLEAEAKANPGKLSRAYKAEADRQYAARNR